MRRGEIYYADLSPTVGSEINKRRPVLIVSNDANNSAGARVTVLPITSQRKQDLSLRLPGKAACPSLPRPRPSRFERFPKNVYEEARWEGSAPPSCTARKMPCAFTLIFNQLESGANATRPSNRSEFQFDPDATTPSFNEPERKPPRSSVTKRKPSLRNSRESSSAICGSSRRAISSRPTSSRATSPW